MINNTVSVLQQLKEEALTLSRVVALRSEEAHIKELANYRQGMSVAYDNFAKIIQDMIEVCNKEEQKWVNN